MLLDTRIGRSIGDVKTKKFVRCMPVRKVRHSFVVIVCFFLSVTEFPSNKFGACLKNILDVL